MITEINILKNEFMRIKSMGYIKASREGTTGIGKTFEDLIGKSEDTSQGPDFKGIEIKTKRAYSDAYTTLFNLTPEGKDTYEIKRLVTTYGYPDKVMKESKVLNISVCADTTTLVANRYLFKLLIDKDNEKIYLAIYDKNFNFIEKEIFWEFNILKQRLYQKLEYLAFIKAWPKKVNNETYYKYSCIDFYKLKSFDEFIYLLERGIIRVTFGIGIFRSGKRSGEIHDRGTSFNIKEKDLDKLFYKLEI